MIHWLRTLLWSRSTPAGRCLAAAVIVSLLLGIEVSIPVYQIFCALVVLLLTTWLAGNWFRPTVSIAGELPSKAVAGQPVSAEFMVVNRGRWTAYDLSFGFLELPTVFERVDAQPALESLAPGESAPFSIALLPRRRGLHELPPIGVWSTFPFGLFRSGTSRNNCRPLLVLPSFHPVAHIAIPFGTRYQPGGITLVSNVGESPEYIGNREYVAGDSARRIDFRSWARLAKPVVREYQEEYYCRVALVLDTFVPPGRKQPPAGFANLEAAISLSASVADALARGEYILDIFAAGPELYVFRSGRHTAHFENVLEILACLEACRENPFTTVAPALADELANISTVICVLLDWDEARMQLVRAAQEAGCSVKILLVRDAPPTIPIDCSDVVDFATYTTAQVRAGAIEQL